MKTTPSCGCDAVGSKVWCCKEQYCIGTWSVMSINQGKFEVVKQEMARVNTDIFGISELKWTGLSKFNLNDHYIYYCGQESLRRNGVALRVNKSPKCSTQVQSQKWQNDLCSFPRQTIQYHSNSNLCPNHWPGRSWSWMVVYEGLQDLLKPAKKDVLFITEYQNAKVGSQETPGITGNLALEYKMKQGKG